MTNYKVLQIMRTFSTEQMKEFEKFLQSPFHSTGRDLLQLFGYLKKYHPAYDNDKALKLEHIHSILSGKKQGKAVKADLTRKLLSDLFKQAEKFITIKQFLSHEQNYGLFKLRALNKLDTQGLFEKATGDYQSKNKEGENFAPSELYTNSELANILQDNYLKNENLRDKYFSSFIKSADYNLMGALSILYRTSAALDTFKRNFSYDPAGTLADILPEIINHEKLLEAINRSYPQYFPFIETYYYLYMANYYPGNISYYFLLKEKFYSGIKKYSHYEAYILFKYIEGYMILNRDTFRDFKGRKSSLLQRDAEV